MITHKGLDAAVEQSAFVKKDWGTIHVEIRGSVFSAILKAARVGVEAKEALDQYHSEDECRCCGHIKEAIRKVEHE